MGDIVAHAILSLSGSQGLLTPDGKWRVQLRRDDGPGHRSGVVLDGDGNVVGDADDYIYGGRGWAVHTRPFGGYVKDENVLIVNARLL